MTVKLSMADMVKEPEMPRTTFPYPSAGRPVGGYIDAEFDEENGKYMGMSEEEYLGFTPGDQ